MPRFIYFVPVLVFVLLGIYFAIGLTLEPSRLPSVLIDRPMPEFDLAPIDDITPGFAKKDVLGDISLVNIFGSWCVACLVEHPVLMDIRASKAVRLYGVDWKDEPGAGARWLDRHGNPYERIGDDARGRLAIDLGVTGAPETFVVDGAGRIRYKHVGPITREVWTQTLLPLIQNLRSQGASELQGAPKS